MPTFNQIDQGGVKRRRRKRPRPRRKAPPNVTPDTVLASRDPKYHKRIGKKVSRAKRVEARRNLRQSALVNPALGATPTQRRATVRELTQSDAIGYRAFSPKTPDVLKTSPRERRAERVQRRLNTISPLSQRGGTGLSDSDALMLATAFLPGVGFGPTAIKAGLRLVGVGGAKAATAQVAKSAAPKIAPKAATKTAPRVAEKVAPKVKPKVRPKPTGTPKKAPAPKSTPLRSRPAQALNKSKGGRAVLKTGRGAKGTAKVAIKTATFPIRRPIKTAKYSFAAQAPLAIATGDPLGEAKKVLEGRGVVAGVLGKAAGVVDDVVPTEIGKNIVRDVLDLPANVVPAVYLPLAGIFEAAKGDSSRLDALWKDYKENGLVPALIEGDLDKAVQAAKAHPLFVALEARGVQAGVGRTAGAVARHSPSARIRQAGSRERKSLKLPGGLAPKERTYSPDLLEKAVQVGLDRRRARKQGGQEATTRETGRILNERVDRVVGQEEGARRAGRAREQGEAAKSLKTGRFSRLSDTEQVGVNLAAQNILRSPKTFADDLGNYAAMLDREYSALATRRSEAATSKDAKLIEARMKSNRELRQTVNKLALDSDPDAIFTASRANVQALNAITDKLVKLGVLNERQAAQARAMPGSLVHLNASYGISNKTKREIRDLRSQLKATKGSLRASLRGRIGALKRREQLIDRDGNPLPPERAEALLRELGAEPAGFISQSPSARGPGSFFKAMWPERQTIPKAKRTGKATKEGTFDASFDALLEQRVRGQGIVDAVKGFDRTVREFAVKGLQFKNWREADEARRNPEAFGLPADIPLVPVRLTPLRVKQDEAKTAEEIFQGLDPESSTLVQEVGGKLLDDALREGDGPVVLLPAQVTTRLRAHFQSADTLRKGMQVLSSQFKGVVLPTSPNWMLGNIIDVSMRSALTGTSPWGRNAKLGRKLLNELERRNPEMAARVRSGLVPGSIFGLAEGTKVHRDARQFQGTFLAPFATALGVLRRTPGPKQLADLYVKYRDGVFAFNEKFIERQAQYAQLGKVARADVRRTTGKWHAGLKLGDDAIADLANGLLKTPRQIRYAKSIEETLGQWAGNSPSARAFLVDYAPFAMWTRAASKFVYLTLPTKHPIKLALATMAYEMTEQERDALGLSLFADKPLPPNLQGSIPMGDGGMLPPQSLSSFGTFADYQKSLAETIFPNFDLDSLRGLDFTGKQLTHEDGTPLAADERLAASLLNTAEAYIPFLSMTQRVAEDGATGAVPRSVRPYDEGLVEYLRSLSQGRQITIPVKDESASDAAPWMEEQSTEPEAAPWMEPPTTSSGTAPWMK